MSEKETYEIHKTEYVDKELPTIVYENTKQDGMMEGEHVKILVSDKTSKAAFQTFKQVRDEIGRRNDGEKRK